MNLVQIIYSSWFFKRTHNNIPKGHKYSHWHHQLIIWFTKFVANTMRRHVKIIHKDQKQFSYVTLTKTLCEGHKEFKCDYCGESFTLLPNLRGHIKTIHEGHKDLWKIIYWASSLRIHKKTIQEDHKDFTCEYCRKSYTQAGNLRVHMKTIHEDQKDVKCDPCGKSFSHSHHLRVHIKTIHKCQKDFRCDYCGKSFSHSHDLRVFIKTIHKGLKGFECDACGNFSRR